MKTTAVAVLLLVSANLAHVTPASAQDASASSRPFAPLSIEIDSPSDELVTTSATVDVVASIGGAVDGVTESTCNGRAGLVLRGRVQCAVQLLPGRNAVVVHVRHASGDQASAGVHVTRLKTSSGALIVSPEAITLSVPGLLRVGVVDESGQHPPVQWTISDPRIAELNCESPAPWCRLIARAAGTATISAAQGSRSASTRLTVVADPRPVGSVTGQVAIMDDLRPHDIVHTHQVAYETPYAHLVLVDQDREVTLQGVESWGTLESIDRPHARAPSEGWRIMGETFGGVVMVDGVDWPTALVRAAGPVHSRPWRYQSSGRIEDMAQNDDGTIYLAEIADDGLTAWIVVLDGRTGLQRARLKLPGSDRLEPARCDVPETKRSVGVLAWTAPLIDGESAAVAMIERHERVRVESCTARDVDFTETLSLLRVTPGGTPSWQPIHEVSGRMAAEHSGSMLSIGGVIPDPEGGVLTIWKAANEASPSTWQITRAAAGTVKTYALPLRDPDFDNVMMTDERLIIQSVSENRILSVDPVKGTVQWSASTSGELLGVLGTSIVLRTSRGTVDYLDDAGRVTKTLDIEGSFLPTQLGLIEEKPVISQRRVAHWPYFAGMGRPLPARRVF